MRGVRSLAGAMLGMLGMLFADTSAGQPGPLEYAFLIGNANQESAGYHVIDPSGNTYITGGFQGTVDFDPGPGTVEQTAFPAEQNGYLAKYDPNGSLIYIRIFHGDGRTRLSDIDFTSNGDLLLSGTFNHAAAAPGDEIDFDPGPGRVIAPGGADRGSLLLRMSPSGQFLSLTTWIPLGPGSVSFDDTVNVDQDDNVYISGNYQADSFDADPGPGVVFLPFPSVATPDLFILKLDKDGNLIYAKAVNGADTVAPLGQAVDLAGNLYVVGPFAGTADFDPDAGIQNMSTGGPAFFEVFLLKLDPNGAYMNAVTLVDGTTETDNYANDIDVDPEGNIYVTGRFTGSADFDPTGGTFNLTTPGVGHNMFLTKLDPAFNLVFAQRYGDVDDTNGISLYRTQFNSLYIAGWFTGTVDFDPGPGVANLTSGSASPYDGYLLRLNPDGSYNYAFSLGSTDRSYIGTAHLDDAYRFYFAGRHRGTADFEPGAGTFPLTSAGTTYDLYAAKLGPDPNPPVPNAPYVVGIEPYEVLHYTAPVFRVTFSEPVTGLDASDLVLSGTTGASVFGFEVRGNDHFVAINMNPVEGEIVRLDLIDDDTIVSTGTGTPLGAVGAGNGSFFDGTPIHVNYPGISNDPGRLDYAFSIGDPAANDSEEDLVLDFDGNTYVTGHFDGATDFDPGAGSTVLTNTGLRDGYVAKYDPSGNLLFAVNFGGADSVSPGRIGFNRREGGVYVFGGFDGTVDFDPGAGSQLRTSAGNSDLFLLKLDENGHYSQVLTFGGAGEEDWGDMFIDPYSNIFIGGGYEGVGFDADPGPGVAMLPDSQLRDMYYIRIDRHGDYRGSYHAGSTGDDDVWGIVQGRRGEMFLACTYDDVIDLDPDPPVYNLFTQLGTQGVVVRLSHDGDFLSAAPFYSANFAVATDFDFWDMDVDAQGNVYLSGLFDGEIDFDPNGLSSFDLVADYGEEGFLVKLDEGQQFGYAIKFSAVTATPTRSWGLGVAVDRFGGAWLGGSFRAPTDFDPAGPTLALTPPGARDGYLLRINADGNLGFAHQLSATTLAQYQRLVFDRLARNLHGIGALVGTGDFAVGDSVYNVTSPGSGDSFVTKMHFELPHHYLHLPFVDNIADTGSKAIGTVTLEITFTNEVTGVDITDFALEGPGTGIITNVSGTGNIYFVTVEYDDQAGPITLNVLDDDTIVDVFTGAPLGGVGVGNGYHIGNESVVPQDNPVGLPVSSSRVLAVLFTTLLLAATVVLRRNRCATGAGNDA